MRQSNRIAPPTNHSHSEGDRARTSKTCEWCGRSFAKASHLIRHTRSHVHEKPFSCPTCGKLFARVDALQRHERTVHAIKKLRIFRSTASTAPDDNEPEISDAPSSRPGEPSTSPSHAPVFCDPSPPLNFTLPALHSPPNPLLHAGLQDELPLGAPLPEFHLFQDYPIAVGQGETGSHLDLGDLFGDWLFNDSGAALSDNTLSQVFADPIQPDLTTNDLSGIFDFSSLSSDTRCDSIQKTSDVTEPTWNTLDAPPSHLHLSSATAGPSARSLPLTFPSPEGLMNSIRDAYTSRASRTVLAADTWESGIPHPPSKASSPHPEAVGASRIISPEQVVGELDVAAPEVRTVTVVAA